ncbi:MAG TPA: DUF167 domain-containing protein [bacterium]|nr:DUF167 domain-containing protein [bacterium]
MELVVKERADGVTFECRVAPRAGKSAVKGVRNGALHLALGAPPVDGRANEELVKYLATLLRVSKSRVFILSGERGRTKLVFIQGIKPDELLCALFGKS